MEGSVINYIMPILGVILCAVLAAMSIKKLIRAGDPHETVEGIVTDIRFGGRGSVELVVEYEFKGEKKKMSISSYAQHETGETQRIEIDTKTGERYAGAEFCVSMLIICCVIIIVLIASMLKDHI